MNCANDGSLNKSRINGSATGRYPANLVLSHHPECRCVGTRPVQSNGHYPAARGKGGNGTAGHSGQDGLTERHTSGEAVEAYECHPDCPVRMLDEQSGERHSAGRYTRGADTATNNVYGSGAGGKKAGTSPLDYIDSGGASRFFYCPKASRKDRGKGNTHPTVKSTKLCEWLIRLITPQGGIVLDPFMGSGSIGVASVRQGYGFVGIEKEVEYMKIAKRRIDEAIRERAELLPLE